MQSIAGNGSLRETQSRSRSRKKQIQANRSLPEDLHIKFDSDNHIRPHLTVQMLKCVCEPDWDT